MYVYNDNDAQHFFIFQLLEILKFASWNHQVSTNLSFRFNPCTLKAKHFLTAKVFLVIFHQGKLARGFLNDSHFGLSKIDAYLQNW